MTTRLTDRAYRNRGFLGLRLKGRSCVHMITPFFVSFGKQDLLTFDLSIGKMLGEGSFAHGLIRLQCYTNPM